MRRAPVSLLLLAPLLACDEIQTKLTEVRWLPSVSLLPDLLGAERRDARPLAGRPCAVDIDPSLQVLEHPRPTRRCQLLDDAYGWPARDVCRDAAGTPLSTATYAFDDGFRLTAYDYTPAGAPAPTFSYRAAFENGRIARETIASPDALVERTWLDVDRAEERIDAGAPALLTVRRDPNDRVEYIARDEDRDGAPETQETVRYLDDELRIERVTLDHGALLLHSEKYDSLMRLWSTVTEDPTTDEAIAGRAIGYRRDGRIDFDVSAPGASGPREGRFYLGCGD